MIYLSELTQKQGKAVNLKRCSPSRRQAHLDTLLGQDDAAAIARTPVQPMLLATRDL